MKRHVAVLNKTRRIVLLEKAAMADRFGSRLAGLLGAASLPPGHGLVLKPCRSVHSWGMRFSLDVGFVDGSGRLCHLIHGLRPFRFSAVIKEAVYVIEAPAGTFRRTGTREGDLVALEFLEENE